MTKKRPNLLIAFLGLFVLAARNLGHAQIVVQRAGVVTARALTGQVVVGLMNVPAKGATVELRTADWQTVIAATKADDDGNFSLATRSAKLYFLRVSLSGANPYQLIVRIKKHAAHELEIHLIVAT
jgi:hypothetical protein